MGAAQTSACSEKGACSACEATKSPVAPIKVDGNEVVQLRQLLEESAQEQERARTEGQQREVERREELRRAEERRVAAERAKQEAFLLQQQALAEQARRRQEAELRAQEQSRIELERQRELAAQRAEAAALTAAVEREAQVQADNVALETFLEKHGFSDVNELKKFPRGLMRSRKCSPLHMAVELNDTETVRLLIARGADVQAKTSGGKRAYDLAQKLGQENPRASDLLALLQPK